MAIYLTTSWQPDDELTSEKLNQMCQNEEYLYTNTIGGVLINQIAQDTSSSGTSNSGVPMFGVTNGRPQGSFPATKMAVCYATYFYSGTPIRELPFFVSYPNIFSVAPIVTITASTGLSKDSQGSGGLANNAVFPYISYDDDPNQILVTLRTAESTAQAAWGGSVMVHAVGY